MGNHFGREWPVTPGPAHVPLNAFAKGFLTDTQLQRAKPTLLADRLSDGLIDRHATGAASGEGLAGDQTAHRGMVAISRAGKSGCRIVDPTHDVDIVAEPSQRLEAGSDPEILTFPYGEGENFTFEIDEAMACIAAGKLESAIHPLAETLATMQTMDTLRAQWGLKYDGEGSP